jgi:hypothetical protein
LREKYATPLAPLHNFGVERNGAFQQFNQQSRRLDCVSIDSLKQKLF